VEPDGIPNALNIPTSTLQSNIWYHLGLAYYLKGDFKRAAKAYRKCIKVSTNPDMLVATVHWLYMTYRRMGKEKEANDALELVAGEQRVIENSDYYNLIKVYRGELKAGKLSADVALGQDTLSEVSLGYGLGNWYLYNGKPEIARTLFFSPIVAGRQWASFGFIAAEADLARLKP